MSVHKEHTPQKQGVESRHKKGLSKSFYKKIYILLAAALALFALYNIYQVSSFSDVLDQKLMEAKEIARPAKVKLTLIGDSGCEDCFDIVPIVASLKKLNINITKEEKLELGSGDANELIKKYNIEKIPTILLFGEINKTRINDLENMDDALVFTKLSPPYTDAESGKIIGRISVVTIKDSSCDKCVDLEPILEEIKKLGIKIVSEKVLEKSDQESKKLIDKYAIEKLPTLILSGNVEAYGSEIVEILEQPGSIESDGSYVLTEIAPPYWDLNEKRVKGLVSMTSLVDNDCGECYKISDLHKPILQRMGVVLKEEKEIDISSTEGKELLARYNLTDVPTIILEGDVEEYPVLVNAWKGVGTVEDDVYVFRKLEILGQKYKDLTTGEIVDPQAST